MRLAVYLPLLLPLVVGWGAQPLARWLPPRLATWLLTAGAVVLAGCSTLALGLLAATGLARTPQIARIGRFSVEAARRNDPAAVGVSVVAAVVLAGVGVLAVRMLYRRGRALAAAYRRAARLPGDDELVVVPDPDAAAYALPGRPGRVVVCAGLWDSLSSAQREVLLAHERAHLAGRHHLFLAAVHLAASANPLLRPMSRAVAYSLERWADEHAAARCGDRRLTARTIAAAALIATPGRSRVEAVLGVTGPAPSLTGAGPIPRRVVALLGAPPRRRLLLPLAAVIVVAASALCVIDSAHDLDTLMELARAALY